VCAAAALGRRQRGAARPWGAREPASHAMATTVAAEWPEPVAGSVAWLRDPEGGGGVKEEEE